MKKGIYAIILCAALCGCNSAPVQTEIITSETAPAATVSATTAAITTTVRTTTTTAETTEAAETEPAEEPKEEYGKLVEVSEDNIFIDFDFITGLESDVPDEADEKAVLDYFTESDQFRKHTAIIPPEATGWSYPSEYPYEDFKDGEGSIVPKLFAYYPDDYDGDGAVEAFYVVQTPYIFDEQSYEYSGAKLAYYLIYGKDGGFETLWGGSWCFSAQKLDYGICKHLIVSSEGGLGNETYRSIAGVSFGEPKVFYSVRGGFNKTDFLLGAYGWQSSGGTMYYDTAAQDYRFIVGEPISYDELFAMDSTGVIHDWAYQWRDFETNENYKAVVIGKKYYCVYYDFMAVGTVYVYENGEFKLYADEDRRDNLTAVRYTYEGEYRDLDMVKDIDIDKALAQMLSPEEAKSWKIEKEKNDAERKSAYAQYLKSYSEEWEPYGVYIGDINLDGGIEMVIMTNPLDLGVLLYYNSEGLQVLELETVSDRGYVCYDKETGMIDNFVDYGRTQSTFGYMDCRVYCWDGEDYVLDMWLYRQGGYYTYGENYEVISKEYGQAYINGEPVSNEMFEEKLGEYRELENDCFEKIPLVLNAEKSVFGDYGADENTRTDYDDYIKEKLYEKE